MPQVFRGSTPSADWEDVARVGDWRLFVRKSEGAWLNAKLVASRPRPRKASFHLAWNADEKRIAAGRDAAILTEHYPQLAVAVREAFEGL